MAEIVLSHLGWRNELDPIIFATYFEHAQSGDFLTDPLLPPVWKNIGGRREPYMAHPVHYPIEILVRVAWEVMVARAKKPKIATSKGKAAPKRRARKASRGAVKTRARATKAKPAVAQVISRDIMEEILVHSAKATEGEQLSDKALTQIAVAAQLDPARVLEAHRRLCEAVDEAEHATVLSVVELWEPYDDREV